MARQLTCPVCGYRPIVLSEREELKLLEWGEATRGESEPEFAVKPPDKAEVWVDCPNRSGEHGEHGFWLNTKTGEARRE